jgi:hypothetical protein
MTPTPTAPEIGAGLMDLEPAMVTQADSIYEIAKRSPSFSWGERAAVDEADVEAALGAYVPGGSSVLCWLPMQDGHTIHQTARDVMRAAIAAVDKRRSFAAAPIPLGCDPVVRERDREEKLARLLAATAAALTDEHGDWTWHDIARAALSQSIPIDGEG